MGGDRITVEPSMGPRGHRELQSSSASALASELLQMVAAQFVEAPDGRCTMSSAPSAAIASATIATKPDGSVTSAAASAAQPTASACAAIRRSRASSMATSTSSRCTPTRRSKQPTAAFVTVLRVCKFACVRVFGYACSGPCVH
jgi:hypothetical protein